MKLVIEGQDVSELLESTTWSGDTKQVARKLNFSIAKNGKDESFPKPIINEGNKVIMQNDVGENVFFGIIIEIDKAASSNVVTCLAYDLMFYVNKSDINQVFDDMPENIIRQIAEEFEIECGNIATTGIQVYMPCLGKKGYEAIMMAYTFASRKNGKKYMPLMQDMTKLAVIEKGTSCGVILNEITDANFKSSIENMVNKVLITDKNGKVVKTVGDAEAQIQYGTVQVICKAEENKDMTKEAENLLKISEQSASVSGLSNDFRAISGYSIFVCEQESGLYGKFYIESDTHNFTNGKADMQLTLAFENLMDEKDIEKESSEKGEAE